MADYVGNGISESSANASSGRIVNDYKHNLLDGPATVEMNTVPVEANYRTLPVTIIAAGTTKYLGDLRTTLMKNANCTDAILKAL